METRKKGRGYKKQERDKEREMEGGEKSES
jgi:hypothetical protein